MMALEQNRNNSNQLVVTKGDASQVYAGLDVPRSKPQLHRHMSHDSATEESAIDISEKQHIIDANCFKHMICDKDKDEDETIDRSIYDETITTRIHPILLSFNGLKENSGKNEALDHLLKEYVKKSKLPPMTKISGKLEAEGISYFELVVAGFLREISVSEVSKESSCAFGIISAFKQKMSPTNGSQTPEKTRIPIFDSTSLQGCKVIFDDAQLDDHFSKTFEYLGGETQDQKKDIATLYNMLPEGIALVNIWNIDINEVVQHFLQALRGHLYNSHIWFIFDTEDNEFLDDTPAEGRQDLTKYRSRLEYSLRSGRMCEANGEKRKDCITVFAKYSDERQKNSIPQIEKKIRQKAKHVGISSLLEPSIQPINLNGCGITDDSSFHLYWKFLHMVYNKPYVDIPVSWVFLRSLFYRSDEKFISKAMLLEKAKKCNMSDESLEKFCKFYTSFGSIFDLTLIDRNYKYVIVKPIGFLKSLSTLLSPSDELYEEHPSLKYGIVSEMTLRKLFNERWDAYIEALVSLNLATKIKNESLEVLDVDENSSYFFVPLSRKSSSTPLNIDSSSVYLVTTLDTPHIRKQALFVHHLLELIPGSKLVNCCDKITVAVKDVTNDTTITMVSSNPFTQFKVSPQDNNQASLKIVEAIHRIFTCYEKSEVKYQYVVPCAMMGCEQMSTRLLLKNAPHHILPYDMHCDACNKAGKINHTWNEALKQVIHLCYLFDALYFMHTVSYSF